MPIQIQAPDGTIAEFPDGTPDAVITGVMAKTFGGPKTPAMTASQQRAASDAAVRAKSTPGLVRAANNGFAFGGMGVVDALGAAAETGVHNVYSHATGQPDSGYGMKDAFDAVRSAEGQSSRQFAQQHPVQSIAANVVGAVANPFNRAAGEYVSAAPSLGGAVVRGTATGAGLGAAYGAGSTQPGEDPVRNAKRGATIGAVTGGLSPVVAKVADAAAGAVYRATVRPQANSGPLVQTLKAAKDAAYQRVDDLGVTYTPQAASDLAAGLDEEMQAANISATRHPKAFSMLADIKDRLTKGDPVSMSDLDQMRQEVTRDVSSPRSDPAERFFGNKIKRNIDEFVDSATPEQMASGDAPEAAQAIAKARALNSQYRKVEAVTNAQASARLRAASTASGGNVNNATRQNLRKFIDPTSSQRLRNLTPDEQAALQTAVTGTPTQNALRLVGKLSPEGNGLMLAGHGAALLPSHGLSALLAVAGAASKHIADHQTAQNVERLITLMAQGAPGETTNAERELAFLASRNPDVASVYREVLSRLTGAAPALAVTGARAVSPPQ